MKLLGNTKESTVLITPDASKEMREITTKPKAIEVT
jgi:hypothetical protein